MCILKWLQFTDTAPQQLKLKIHNSLLHNSSQRQQLLRTLSQAVTDGEELVMAAERSIPQCTSVKPEVTRANPGDWPLIEANIRATYFSLGMASSY